VEGAGPSAWEDPSLVQVWGPRYQLYVVAARDLALGNGRILASDLAARGEDAQQPGWRSHIRAVVEDLLPVLTYVSFPLLVRGEYDMTPDHQPILGSVDEGVFVAAGFSGHGFMIAPAVARILAEVVLGGPADPVLEILDVGRFAENRLVPEPQLV
jgi:sarcosine oxidase subunit beta